MARLGITGFEAGANTREAENGGLINGTCSVQSTIKRSGSWALRVNPVGAATGYADISTQNNANWTSALIDPGLATAYIRFYIYVATAPSSYEKCIDIDPGKCSVFVQSSGGGFILRVTDAGPTNYDNATVLSLNQWYRVELVVGTGVGTAVLSLYVDGLQWMNSSTANTTGSNLSAINLGKNDNTNSQSVDFYYDDVAIDDSQLPGPGSIVMLYPNAAGTDQTWTATGAGTHQGCVDDWNRQDADDGDSTYLVVSASGTQAEEENCLDYTGNFLGQSVVCVLACLVQRNASGSANVGTPRLRSGSTNSDGTAYDPGSGYTVRFKLFTTDPATGAAWTLSALDSLQVGFVKTQSQARAMRLTACAVMVELAPPFGKTVAVSSRRRGRARVSFQVRKGRVSVQAKSRSFGQIIG